MRSTENMPPGALAGQPVSAGVDGATKKIQDGQMIRVNGNLGYVEISESGKNKVDHRYSVEVEL